MRNDMSKYHLSEQQWSLNYIIFYIIFIIDIIIKI